MVVQEPESSPLSKLRHYLNLSDDKDVEISLEDEQSLEDVVLADDRERQMRNNEEALSMAIEKSLSPIQKFADFFVAKAWTDDDVQKYHNDLYTHMQEKSPELAQKFGDFISLLDDNRFRNDPVKRGKKTFYVPAYKYDSYIIWGLTAMITVNFLNLVFDAHIDLSKPVKPIGEKDDL